MTIMHMSKVFKQPLTADDGSCYAKKTKQNKQEMDASGVEATATAYATAVHAALATKQHGKMLVVRSFVHVMVCLWWRTTARTPGLILSARLKTNPNRS